MLHVDKVDSLLTEQVRISASNLQPSQCYKFYLKLNYKYGAYHSFCVVQADQNGAIDLTTDRPVRGTYHEVDPMGLFQSIQPSEEVRKGHYFRNLEGAPFIYTLRLINNSETVIDKVLLLKRWMHPSVIRIPVVQDKLYGTILKPPGPGPFPCIIELPGMNGKVGTSRAEIFSLSGFLVYTMATFDYKDLPKEMKDADVETYSKHIEIVKSLPYCSGRIGIYGSSFAGTLVLHLATLHPELSAVVSVNGPESFLKEGGYMKENGEYINCETFDDRSAVFVNGVHKQQYAFLELFNRLKPETSIKWERISKSIPFRIVAALDDYMLPAVSNSSRIRANLLKTGHHVEIEFINGGHSQIVPYCPHLPFIYNRFIKKSLGFGGDALSHGKAQEKVWKNHIKFFKKHLGTPPSLPGYMREIKIEKSLKNKL